MKYLIILLLGVLVGAGAAVGGGTVAWLAARRARAFEHAACRQTRR